MVTPEPVVALSALEHYEYCPRQCALIHVDGMWEDNAHTVRGQHGHRRADSGLTRSERGKTVLRAVPLWSEVYGLTGRSDVVEVGPGPSLTPVEYKIGTRHGIAADVQVCAQALCLEEMTSIPVPLAYVWMSSTRRRRRVDLHPLLRGVTLERIEQVRRTVTASELPVAVDDQRCANCQFLYKCQPGLSAHSGAVTDYVRGVIFG